MAQTSIEWATHVWNPFTGCDVVSPGCGHCYAETLAKRLKAMGNPRYQVDGDPKTSGPGFGFTVHWDKLDNPERFPVGARVFVNSMSDVFHEEASREAIAVLWGRMAAQPDVDFLILTKRPKRMLDELTHPEFENIMRRASGELGHELPLPNVWLGVSIENRRFVHRADLLRETPAAIRFISAEPLLGPLLMEWEQNVMWRWEDDHEGPELNLAGIDWLIVGGESGPKARPMDVKWARLLQRAASATDTAFFLKQMGGRYPGGELEDLPEDLRVRELPEREAVAA